MKSPRHAAAESRKIVLTAAGNPRTNRGECRHSGRRPSNVVIAEHEDAVLEPVKSIGGLSILPDYELSDYPGIHACRDFRFELPLNLIMADGDSGDGVRAGAFDCFVDAFGAGVGAPAPRG